MYTVVSVWKGKYYLYYIIDEIINRRVGNITFESKHEAEKICRLLNIEAQKRND